MSGEAEEERRAAAAAIESEKRRKAEKVSTQSSGDALIIDEKIGQLDYKLAKSTAIRSTATKSSASSP